MATWTIDVTLSGGVITIPSSTGTLAWNDVVQWRIKGAKGCRVDINLDKHRTGAVRETVNADPFLVTRTVLGPRPTLPPRSPDIKTASYSLSLNDSGTIYQPATDPELVIDTSGGPVMVGPDGPPTEDA